MSAARLRRASPPEICDDIESIFYVILYMALYYLRLNIASNELLGNWFNAFFDSVRDDRHSSGDFHDLPRIRVIEKGRIDISPEEDLCFGSPMDDVVSNLLKWLSAHFSVTEYRHRPVSRASGKDLNLGSSSTMGIDGDLAMGANDLRPPRGYDAQATIPTEKQIAYSNLLIDHRALMRLLKNVLDEPSDWPDDDRVEQRIFSRTGTRSEESSVASSRASPACMAPPSAKRVKTSHPKAA